ncbi:hypothetical protein [Haliangium sp.]|uniref:hypothetical protein n=1 Tax=Haliangium sp. TaxID=2663208 RepID=UPI003D0FC3D8
MPSSLLAVVAWVALVAGYAGTNTCGSLLCGLAAGTGCCPSGADDAEPPDHDQAHRGPCGCCGEVVHACATAPGPVVAAAEFSPPAPDAVPTLAPAHTAGALALRRTPAPPLLARPPPLASPTATVVLLL